MCIRRLATLPLNILYRSRPLNLAVREHGKGQEAHTPVIARKTRFDKLPEGVGYKPTLDRVDLVSTYWHIK